MIMVKRTLGGSLHFLREQKRGGGGGGGGFVIRSPEGGSLKFLQGFGGGTTKICLDNAQMVGKLKWSRLRILDLVFNSTCLAF